MLNQTVSSQDSRLQGPELAYADSIMSGLLFLNSRHHLNGSWKDYDTLAGPSDEWVTAYVGASLAEIPVIPARSMAERAYTYLARRRPWSWGWGYNGKVPCDADSTIWALILGERLGAPMSWKKRRSYSHLKKISRDGGMPTFPESGPIRLYTRLAKNFSFQGWCASHVCATAAAGQLTGWDGAGTRAFLKSHQEDDGSWKGYWWSDFEYATTLAFACLHGHPDTRENGRRALQWATNRISEDGSVRTARFPKGSVFATAWLLRLFRIAQCEVEAGRLAEWLQAKQLPDGSWPESSSLRIPPPDCTDPDSYRHWNDAGRGGGSYILDKNRVFTTATVLFALAGQT